MSVCVRVRAYMLSLCMRLVNVGAWILFPRHLLSAISDIYVLAMRSMFDVDGSGELDYEEFQKIVDSFEVVEMD